MSRQLGIILAVLGLFVMGCGTGVPTPAPHPLDGDWALTVHANSLSITDCLTIASGQVVSYLGHCVTPNSISPPDETLSWKDGTSVGIAFYMLDTGNSGEDTYMSIHGVLLSDGTIAGTITAIGYAGPTPVNVTLPCELAPR